PCACSKPTAFWSLAVARDPSVWICWMSCWLNSRRRSGATCKSSNAAAKRPIIRFRWRASKRVISNASSAACDETYHLAAVQARRLNAMGGPLMPRIAVLSAILLSVAGVASAADVDPYLPDDAEAVLTVNVRQILDSPLIKKHALESVQKLLESSSLKDLKDLDLDLQKDIDRLVFANSGSEADRLLFIAHGRYEVAKFEAKALALANAQPKQWKITLVPDGAGGQYKILESSRWFDLTGKRPGVK